MSSSKYKPFKDKRFCSDVFQFIKNHDLIQPQKRYLLAVSGGIDSMVMLHFFQRFAKKRYGCEFAVAHLDHGLRHESAEQALRLQEHCKANGLDFFCKRVELESNQAGVEARARDARYLWLGQVLETHGFDAICTAHHAKDQLETILMQYIRGGIHLSGIHPVQSLKVASTGVLRPFLNTTRDSMVNYHAHYQLLCLEDVSNNDLRFLRNRIRHTLLPVLLQENPHLEANATPQALIRQTEQLYLQEQVNSFYDQYVKHNETSCSVAVESFTPLHLALQRLLIKKMLTHLKNQWRAFDACHIESVIALVHGDNKKGIVLPSKITASKQNNRLLLAFDQC